MGETKRLRIYLASSWRNPHQPAVLAALRGAGHQVYDFRNPIPGDTGFSWRQISEKPPQQWTPDEYLAVLDHPIARRGFRLDMAALEECDTCVLVLPCGRSAHLELGYATGAGKRTFVLLDKTIDEPELMYRMCDRLVRDVDELLIALTQERCDECGVWSVEGEFDEGQFVCAKCADAEEVAHG